jgi:hypothetical protein
MCGCITRRSQVRILPPPFTEALRKWGLLVGLERVAGKLLPDFCLALVVIDRRRRATNGALLEFAGALDETACGREWSPLRELGEVLVEEHLGDEFPA